MYEALPYQAVVTGVGSFVPENVLTNADFEKMVETTDEWIVSRTGIRERHILPKGQATSDMALEAAKKALEVAKVDPEEIEIVVCGTFTPDYVFPSTACMLQSKLGLKNAGCFDLAAACSGFVYGLTVGSQFITTGKYKKVLVIGADANSRLVDYEDRNTCVLFGDGAGAVVLEQRPMVDDEKDRRGLLSSFLRADGNGWVNLFQPAGGSLRPPTHETIDEHLHHIKMDGKEVFKFASNAMWKASLAAIEAANLTPDDIDLVVPHQANVRIIKNALRRIKIPNDKVIINIDRYGNTVAASVGLALDEAYREGRLADGMNVLLVAFGAGSTWGGIVIRWGC